MSVEKRPRILLLFPHYNNLDEASSLRSPQIATYLVGKGYDVTVFAPGVNLRSQKILPELVGKLYSDIYVDGVRVIRPRSLQKFRRSFFHRLAFEALFALGVAALLFKVKRPDVVMGAYPPALLPQIGLIFCRLRRIPFIFEVRDLMADALLANEYSKSRIFNKAAVFVENLIYKYCSHIVTVSDGIKRIIVEKGYEPEKITPVKNGYEPQVFEQADHSLKPRVAFGWGEKFVAIYAGGLTQSYDIPTMLATAERLIDNMDILFVIIGDGHKKEEYKRHCKDKGLENVQILDSLPRKSMPALLSSANVGLHLFPDDPLWSYVLGNKPFDYLGSAIPMIYCGTGDTAELIVNAEAGFVVHPERPAELVEKILWLKDNPKEANAMGERGRVYVQTEFNRFKLLEKLEDVLGIVLGQ